MQYLGLNLVRIMSKGEKKLVPNQNLKSVLAFFFHLAKKVSVCSAKQELIIFSAGYLCTVFKWCGNAWQDSLVARRAVAKVGSANWIHGKTDTHEPPGVSRNSTEQGYKTGRCNSANMIADSI